MVETHIDNEFEHNEFEDSDRAYYSVYPVQEHAIGDYSEHQYGSYYEKSRYQETNYSSVRELNVTEHNKTAKYEGYIYTKDLLALEAKRPTVPPPLPILGKSVTSPLILHNWSAALEEHPDRAFVEYILKGLTHGFHIGFDRNTKCCRLV